MKGNGFGHEGNNWSISFSGGGGGWANGNGGNQDRSSGELNVKDIHILKQGDVWYVRNKKTGKVLKFNDSLEEIFLNDSKLVPSEQKVYEYDDFFTRKHYVQHEKLKEDNVTFELRQPNKPGFGLPEYNTKEYPKFF